jgi:transcriptional regulator with XRE-family HTH domain
MTKKNFKDLIDKEPSKVHEHMDFIKTNKAWLKKSMCIAVGILKVIREKNISQNTLANNLNVSPQYVNKILKGSENLTLETITKIEEILDVQLISIANIPDQTEVIESKAKEVSSRQTKPRLIVLNKKAVKVKTLDKVK